MTARPAGPPMAAGPAWDDDLTAPSGAPVTDISPSVGWQRVDLRELWRGRDVVYSLMWRDLKVRYRQTLLGAAWAILQPAALTAVLTLALGHVAGIRSGTLPAPVFLYAGLLPWTLFATVVGSASASVVGSERLITKVYFPRLAIPLAVLGVAVVDFAFACLPLGAMMLYYGVAPPAGIAAVPILSVLIATAALGVGTFLAALNVAYRDVRFVIPFVVQLWLFATPSVYTSGDAEGLPLVARALLAVNPMMGLTAAFRAATLGTPMPWGLFWVSVGSAVACLVGGCLYFRKVEDSFADVI
jgi:lipopolysaccharide transport system permease protein